MDGDKEKAAETPAEKNEADDGAILDEGWAEVDLHDENKTPEADLPSDLEDKAD